jgi:DNA-binding transcriptional LysR family regulator
MAERSQIKIRLLEVFDAVIRTGTTTGAAAYLGVSQPAVSSSLRTLEGQLGLTLFERDGRNLVPNEVARRLAASTGPIFEVMADLTGDVRRVVKTGAAELRITATASFGHGVALAALRQVLRDHPTQSVSLRVQDNARVQAAVEMGQVDLGLMLGTPASRNLTVVPMARTPLVVLVPRDHGLGKRAMIGPADLVTETLIGSGTVIAPLVAGAFARQGIEYRPQIETGYAQTACAMVQEGIGVAVVDVFSAELFSNSRCSIRRFYPPTHLPALALVSASLTPAKQLAIDAYLEALRAAIDHAPSMANQHRADMYKS